MVYFYLVFDTWHYRLDIALFNYRGEKEMIEKILDGMLILVCSTYLWVVYLCCIRIFVHHVKTRPLLSLIWYVLVPFIIAGYVLFDIWYGLTKWALPFLGYTNSTATLLNKESHNGNTRRCI